MTPVVAISGQPGQDYIVQSMARRADDGFLAEDLTALEGPIFFVKTTQLIFKGNALEIDDAPTSGRLKNPAGTTPPDTNTVEEYQDAVIAFSAEFHGVPTKSLSYLSSNAFQEHFDTVKKPIFTRNLAIRR